MISYLAQMEAAAADADVDLLDAAVAAGVAPSTVWRWRTRGAQPSLDTTAAVIAAIEQIRLADAEDDAWKERLRRIEDDRERGGKE